MKSITFGDAPFSRPEKIGSGIRARYHQQLSELKREKLPQYEELIKKGELQTLARQCAEELFASDEAKKLPGIAQLVINRIAPVLPEAWKNSWIQTNYAYECVLIGLQLILTPESEVTVREAFEGADESEVQELMGNFLPSANSKTNDGTGKTSGTKDSKGRRKPHA